MHKIVILGGGTAGTLVANKLRSRYRTAEMDITVVDVDDDHHYQPGYLFLPFGKYSSQQIVRARHAFIPDGVTLVLGEIQRVDAAANLVHLADGRELTYDTLVIATGVQPRPEATPGGDGPEAGVSIHHFYDLDGATALAEALRNLRGGRVVVHISEMPIKCPVAPLEFTFLADSWMRNKRIRHKYELVYVTPLDGAFTKPVASRELADALAKRDVALETDFAVAEIDNQTRELVSFDDRRIPFDLLVTVPVNMGPDYIAESGLGNELNLVPCDQATLRSTEHANIFVLGDAGTLQTSKAGSVAHFSVDIFMHNFDSYLAGEPLKHSFDGHANCFIESGSGKGMLLDFNYDTQPYTGRFPLPLVGPLRLLKETRLNHWAKLAFRWVYWNLLIVGRPLPFTTHMSRLGKVIEGDVVPATKPAASRPAEAPRTPRVALRPTPARPAARAASRPPTKPASKPKAASSRTATAPVPAYVDRPGVDSSADPATVLPEPIIPTF
ncbi:NAD(P)/FAD-dependent oxidoreductase [Tessaracoccus sp. OS52]|uniref:type III sulfide quinone reductase, selenoprotein subtype n=1 Tax=Tessaracoccus sp. OS52 TaxID=2886691 RepID=UPI001D128282|nr:FAD/NAD(P)-binding oxidoreductase [Tessaracoccus sp. OS52]MCC2593634.1 NAD(P)/FAD-dependent oxidoreductase [Tessaracoccus sp. OS52]